MDGLASGVAYICAMLFFFVAARQGQFFIGLIYLALAGSLLGFLFFNFFPARIFLGDTGSLLIGFLMATIIVLQSFGTESQESFFPILMPVIILSLPIFDTLRVILIRIKEKRSIFQGDQCHISHKLVDLGMSRPQAVVTVYVMTFSLGIGCTILDLSNRLTNWIILAQVLTMILMIILLMEFSRKVPHGSD
jgi:UDP-GlcNAc:undecaprenyl-phosphate GlcNAc-1-phosphate transferase